MRAEQTELMVLVTPRLVRALDPDEVPALPVRPGAFINPSDDENQGVPGDDDPTTPGLAGCPRHATRRPPKPTARPECPRRGRLAGTSRDRIADMRSLASRPSSRVLRAAAERGAVLVARVGRR